MKDQKTAGEPLVFDREHRIFSNNYKISPRQIRRAVTLELFGSSSLLLPGYLAEMSGTAGVAALLTGGAAALALLAVWDRLAEKCDFSVQEEIKHSGDGDGAAGTLWLRRILQVIAGVGVVGIAAYVLYLLAILVREQLLDARYEPAILITLTLAGVLGLWKGLESRIRIYEILFWFLLIPLAVILIIASVSVTPVYWKLTETTGPGFFRSCYASFFFFALSALFLFFRPHCSRPEQAARSVGSGIVTAVGLNIVIYLILLGIFQQKLLAQLNYPVILLMAVVRLPGEFFERQDALMTGIWFFCLFALFASLLFYGKELLRGGFSHKKDRKPKEKPRQTAASPEFWWSTACGGAVFAAAAVLLHVQGMPEMFLRGIFGGVGPVLLALPFLYYLCARKQRAKEGGGAE